MKTTFIIVLLAFVTFSNSFCQLNSKVPVINFDELNIRLKTTNDTILVLNFWATWCVPCRKELPEFEKIKENYKGKPVKVLLVSLDFINQLDHLERFISINNISSEVVVLNDPNANNWINKVDASWSGSLPATLFLKKDYKKFYEGEINYQIIQTEINSMLKL